MDDSIKGRVEAVVRKTMLSSIRNDTPLVKQILSCNEKEFSFLIDEIFKSQSKAITIAFREKESIVIPAFGFFKYQPAREKVFEEMGRVARRYGYNRITDIKDPVLRGLIMNELKPIIKQIYFDNTEHTKNKTEVLGNIFRK